MPDIRELYLAFVVLHTLVSGGLLAYAWTRRRVAGARSLMMLLATSMTWMLGLGLTSLSVTEAQANLWFVVRTVGVFLVTPAFYMTVSEYTGRGPAFQGWWRLVLWGMPLLYSIAFLARVPFFGVFHFVPDGGLLVWDAAPRGPGFFAGWLYMYGLSLVGIARLVRHAIRAPHGERFASIAVALGASAPVLNSLGRQTGLVPVAVSTFLMPVALNLMSATFVLAVLRYRWLDLSPLARNLLDALADPLFVQDPNRRFLLVNDAFARWVGLPPEEILGRTDGDLFPASVVEGWREADARLLRTPSRSALEQTCHDERNGVVMVTHRSLYHDPSGEPLIVGVMRDVTDLEHVRAELETKVGELQAALVEVKRLRGILPICMYCKKIRDDSNYWQRVEEYFMARTEAVFSHGVCPDCAGRALADAGGQQHG